MAYSPLLKSKDDLKKYIKSKLGSPVINIAITDDQLNFAIEDTLELYLQRAYAGNLERYVPITLLEGVTSYILPYDVFAVLRVHSTEIGGLANNAPSNIWSINQFIAADLYRGSGKIDMLTYTMTNNMLATLDVVFRRQYSYDFNCITKELLLFESPKANEKVLIHLYKKNVPQDINPIDFNNYDVNTFAIDINNRNYVCGYNILPNSEFVILNGIVLVKGFNNDYTLSIDNRTIVLNDAIVLKEGYMLQVKYIKYFPDSISSGGFDGSANIFSELIVRKLATEYSRKQWAQNMMLYGGSTMPNGIQINADAILNEANTNIDKLELELHETYELPCDFMIGIFLLFLLLGSFCDTVQTFI